MAQTEALSEDPQDLRRCVRDLVALSTLPALWIKHDARQIAASVTEVLVRMLGLEFAYVWLPAGPDGPPLEVAQSADRAVSDPTAAIRGALGDRLRRPLSGRTMRTANPLGAGSVRVAVVPIDAGDGGVLVVASRRTGFPTEAERLLVAVAASQAAAALQRWRAERALREETRRLETLNRTGAALAAELDLERIVQTVTDAGTELTGARFGAFFYNVQARSGESYLLYTLSGAPRAAFAGFPMPRNTAVFGATFRGEGVIRSDDITGDPRYGHNPPYHGMPAGHLPVRSYLAAPVIARAGEVLGGLFFGHPDPAVFTEAAERLISGIAAQAAIALDNARLYRAAQTELAERRRVEATLRAVYATAPVGLCFTDAEHRYVSINDRMAAFNGRPAAAHLGRTVREVLAPPLADAVEAIRQRVLDTGESVLDIELAGATAAAPEVERHWLASYHPVRDADGAILGVNAVVQDISERKRAEEQRELLLAELSHRVKNILAVVQAIAERTGAGATSVATFLAAFEGRLSALAAAHSLLTASNWQGASLRGLIAGTLAPYLDGGGRVRLEVEDLALQPAAAQTLALAFHELATNADKHGALSTPGGRVALTARIKRRGAGSELRVVWKETGGPPVGKPARTGFGTALLERAIAYQHGGRVDLDWRREGLVCRLGLPLEEAVAPQPSRRRPVRTTARSEMEG